MIRNILLSAIASLKRKKMASLFTILTISLGMTMIVLALGIYQSFTGNVGPYQQRNKCLFLSKVSFTLEGKTVQRSLGKFSTISFIDNQLRKIQTPKLIGLYRGTDNVEWNLGSIYKQFLVKYMETDANFWKILQFNYLAGRPYNEEEIKNRDMVCVISKKTAMFLFNDIQVVGKHFEYFNRKYRIVGVIEDVHPRFEVAADLYAPYTQTLSAEDYYDFDKHLNRNIYLYRGSFKGIVLANQVSDIKIIKREFGQLIKKMNEQGKVEEFDQIQTSLKTAAELVPEMAFLSSFKIPFPLFIILVMLVFMLPIIILSNINQYSLRERIEEIGLKRAFGANQRKLFFQFMAENILITAIGCVVALTISIPLFRFLSFIIFQTFDGADLQFNFDVVVYLLIGILVFSFLTGVVPIVRISKIDPVNAIQNNDEMAGYSFLTGIRKKGMKVVTYFLLFTILSLSCSLLVYLYSISLSPLGYQTKNLLTIAVSEEGIEKDWEEPYNAERYNGFKERLMHIKGIEDVSYVLNTLPFLGGVPPQDKPYLIDGSEKQITTIEADTSFLHILQLIPFKGKLFSGHDLSGIYCPAAVTRAAEKEFFNGDAVDKIIQLKENGQKIRITGVINKYRHSNFDKAISGIILCRNKPSRCVIIRYNPTANLKNIEVSIDNAIKDQLTAKYFYNNRGTLEDNYNDYSQKTIPIFYGILLVMSFILMNALFGYFTLSYYNVKHRKKELGIRRVSGATKSRIYFKILTENLTLMLAGSAIALSVVYQLKILVLDSIVWQYFQFGIILAFGIAIVTSIITTLYPAYIAARVHPVEAMAEE